MIKVTKFIADDGREFDTEKECLEYENSPDCVMYALEDLVRDHITSSYCDDAGFHIIEVGDVVSFVYEYREQLISILSRLP